MKTTDEINASWKGLDRPMAGKIFQHYKGGSYEIVATGFLEDSVTPCVIYRSKENTIVWVRTAKDFFEDIEHEGVVQPRFKPV